MAETRLGRIVHTAPSGHMVVEVMEPDASSLVVTGFVLVGPQASASIIYDGAQEALEALHDLETRLSAG